MVTIAKIRNEEKIKKNICRKIQCERRKGIGMKQKRKLVFARVEKLKSPSVNFSSFYMNT